jgi:hypothetical protein
MNDLIYMPFASGAFFAFAFLAAGLLDPYSRGWKFEIFGGFVFGFVLGLITSVACIV